YIELIVSAIQSNPSVFDQSIPEELCEICHKAMSAQPAQRYQSVQEFQGQLDEYLEHTASRKIAQRARERLQSGFLDAKRSMESGDLVARNDGYRDFAEAVSGFRQARELWADNALAEKGEEEARAAYIRLALDNGDLGLAEAQLANLRWDGTKHLELELKVLNAKRERTLHKRRGTLLKLCLIFGTVLLIMTLSIGLLLVTAAQNETKGSRDTALRKEKAARDALTVAAAAQRASERNERLAQRRYSLALKQLGDLALAQNKSFEAQAYYSRFLEVGDDQSGKLGLFFARSCAGASFLWTKTYPRKYRRPLFAVSKKNSVLAALIPGRGIELTDLSERKVIRLIDTKDLEPITAFTVSANGEKLIVGSGKGLLSVWDLRSGRRLWSKSVHKSAVTSIAVSESPERLVTMERRWLFYLWDLKTGQLLKNDRVEINGVNKGFLSADGQKLIYQCPGIIGAIDFRTGQRVSQRIGYQLPGQLLAANADNSAAVLANSNRAPQIHNLSRTGSAADLFFVNKEITANAAAWHGLLVALADSSGFIQVWDFKTKRLIRKFRNNFESISEIEWANDGRALVAASPSGRIVAWEIEREPLRLEQKVPSMAALTHFVASHDGRYLGFGTKKTKQRGPSFRLWDTKEEKLHDSVIIDGRYFLGLSFFEDQLLYLTRNGFGLYDPKNRKVSLKVLTKAGLMPRSQGVLRKGCLIYPSVGKLVSYNLKTKTYRTLSLNSEKNYSGFSTSKNKRWLIVQSQRSFSLVDLEAFQVKKVWQSRSHGLPPIVDDAGVTILTASPKGTHFIRKVDGQSLQMVDIGPMKNSARYAEFARSEGLVFSLLSDHSLGILDWKQKRLVYRFRARYITESARKLTLSGDGDSMFLYCSGVIQKWSLKQWYSIELRSPKDLARQVRQETQLILDGTDLKSLLPDSERGLTKK
ncbi:MAG: hypothetical protein P1V97_24295, partial [Planctomycetota bacterium]|nr:hypothetical protein [Planctomycetota bacterium]